MTRPRLERLAVTAEIAASVAVVVSIVYLAGEVRTNTEAVRASTNQGLLEIDLQRGGWLLQDSTMRRIVRDAEAGAEVTDLDDQRVLEVWAISGLSMWEQAYFSNLNGVMDARVWAAWDRALRVFVCAPAFYEIWSDRRQGFGTEFQAHADSVRVDGCGDS